MRIRKDSLVPEKIKNAGAKLKLFEVIRCPKAAAHKFDFSGLKPTESI
jgi:hypothetical protein